MNGLMNNQKIITLLKKTVNGLQIISQRDLLIQVPVGRILMNIENAKKTIDRFFDKKPTQKQNEKEPFKETPVRLSYAN